LLNCYDACVTIIFASLRGGKIIPALVLNGEVKIMDKVPEINEIKIVIE